MRRALACAAATLALAACGKLQNFGGSAPPLVTFSVTFDGDPAPLAPAGEPVHALKVALVWGAQWLTEPFCVLPPESPAAAAVITAGCRDTFGFVPARVDQSAPIVGQAASLALQQLPTADVLIGDVTARVAYGSLVVYDDRNDSNVLELSQPQRTPAGGDRGDELNNNTPDAVDVVYGASFLTMTAHDQRVAYREGAFDTNGAFYPRAGCDPPLPGFSILAAGGFSPQLALAATLAGTLPQEDPATCAQTTPDTTVVDVAARAPADVEEVGCAERTDDSSSRYREPPTDAPDFSGRVTACAHIPSFDTGGFTADGGAGTSADGGADGGVSTSSLIQLVVSGRATDRCKGLTHYALRGCRESVSCALPDWDFTANPPTWWPCTP
jgi:hypothetical protein